MKSIQLQVLVTFLLFPLTTGKIMAEAAPLQKNDTIAFICLNDFHGGFIENSDQGIPGAGNVFSQIQQIKKRYPNNVVLSAGDNFGGSFFSNLTKGELIPYFFTSIGISTSALGNHEFDNGQEFLRYKWRNIANNDTLVYVCSNLNDSEGKIPGYAKPYTVKNIKMSDGSSLKCAILGMIASSAGMQTKSSNVKGLTFRGDYSQIINNLENTPDLKNIKWQILLAHIGTGMAGEKPVWQDKDSANLATLPKYVIGIASGHSHKKVCGRLKGIPVVQGEISGKYIGVLRFVYDTSTKTLTAIDPYVVEVKHINDSSPERKKIDQQILNTLNATKDISTGLFLTQKIAHVSSVEGLPHERHKDEKKQTALGTYVCMAYAQAYRETKNLNINDIVLGISHFGGIRASLPKGDINVLTAGEVLPFSNKLKVYNMKGKEIIKLIEAGLSNPYGYLQLNNVIIDTISMSGKTRVVNIRYFVPGKEEIFLGKESLYPVVVDEYITTGGDGYNKTLFPESELDTTVTNLETTPSFLKFLNKTDVLDNSTPFKARLKYYGQ